MPGFHVPIVIGTSTELSRFASHGYFWGSTTSGPSSRVTVGWTSAPATSAIRTVSPAASLATVSFAVSPGTYDDRSNEASTWRIRTIGARGASESRVRRPYLTPRFPDSSVSTIAYVVGSMSEAGLHLTDCQPRFIVRLTTQAGWITR